MSSETSLLNNIASPVLGYDLMIALNRLKMEIDQTDIKNIVENIANLERELSSHISDLSDSVNNMSSNIDQLVERVTALEGSVNDLDNRVSKLEGGGS